MSDKKRIIWIDSIRGVLIILVVLGHAIQSTLRDACFKTTCGISYTHSTCQPSWLLVAGSHFPLQQKTLT